MVQSSNDVNAQIFRVITMDYYNFIIIIWLKGVFQEYVSL